MLNATNSVNLNDQALHIHMESNFGDCNIEIKNFDSEDFIAPPQGQNIKDSDCFKNRFASEAIHHNNKAANFSVIERVGNMSASALDLGVALFATASTGGTGIIPAIIKFAALTKDTSNAISAVVNRNSVAKGGEESEGGGDSIKNAAYFVAEKCNATPLQAKKYSEYISSFSNNALDALAIASNIYAAPGTSDAIKTTMTGVSVGKIFLKSAFEIAKLKGIDHTNKKELFETATKHIEGEETANKLKELKSENTELRQRLNHSLLKRNNSM
ncbi:hypothetical protein GA565_12675 [Rouxiella sp. S1S-2]|uniref:hypothetical protein n=1 Tax=Rouxiella sp. S1S-2 TaxID=2653856 RepID=UPI00126499C8|nr:hypothetical protein [Rouxiella sp. S1S-2]KAB7896762.1 hypothetical protein GA565_12675 [Rouxiella sp. S1S-2]